MRRFHIGEARELSCSFAWLPGQVVFRCWRGLGALAPGHKPIAEWTYNGRFVPEATKEKVHMNLWLAQGLPPLNGKGAEVTITDFRFTPADQLRATAPKAAKPAIRVWVEAGNQVRGVVSGIPRTDVANYGVKVYALTDTWYIQPYRGSIHRIAADLTFKTWTRAWDKLRADLVERATGKVVATATHRPGDPKPTRP